MNFFRLKLMQRLNIWNKSRTALLEGGKQSSSFASSYVPGKSQKELRATLWPCRTQLEDLCSIWWGKPLESHRKYILLSSCVRLLANNMGEEKIKLNPCLTSYTKIESSCTKMFKVQTEIIKVLGKNW